MCSNIFIHNQLSVCSIFVFSPFSVISSKLFLSILVSSKQQKRSNWGSFQMTVALAVKITAEENAFLVDLMTFFNCLQYFSYFSQTRAHFRSLGPFIVLVTAKKLL